MATRIRVPAGGILPIKPQLEHPALARQAMTNVLGVAGQATRAEHEEGRTWYPKVHDATAKGVRAHGLDSTLHGAGVVAAVSPNMDWEKSNIDAFDHMSKLAANPDHLAVLHRSLANVQVGTDKAGRSTARQRRTPEMASLVNSQYPSLAKAPDSNIHKALRIWGGEHPDTVLSPRGAPKTNSFAHNIADPSASVNPHSGRSLVTVDGRANDIGLNAMHPWNVSRGIGSSASVRGKPTRYEHFADAYGRAAQVASAEEGRTVAPSEMQARTWVTGKRIERTSPGAAKDRGPNRVGQPYLSR